MHTTLTIIRYKNWAIPFALISMAMFRIPFLLNRNISFYKLMGSGKNGTFDKEPDFNQWAILAIHKNKIETLNSYSENPIGVIEKLYGKFITYWFKVFSTEQFIFLLKPISGHGLWDKKEVFGDFKNNETYDGPIATMTRATIRLNKLKYFWKNVAPIANKMNNAKGFIYSIGIGETPWIKQATFSVWETMDDMKNFAYSMKEHSDVIKKTRKENWYKEDMFVRFKIIETKGKIRGINPLKRNQ